MPHGALSMQMIKNNSVMKTIVNDKNMKANFIENYGVNPSEAIKVAREESRKLFDYEPTDDDIIGIESLVDEVLKDGMMVGKPGYSLYDEAEDCLDSWDSYYFE